MIYIYYIMYEIDRATTTEGWASEYLRVLSPAVQLHIMYII